MESIGELQVERAAVTAASAISGPTEGLSARYRSGVEIGQKCTSKLFEFAQSNLTSVFEYLEHASKAGSPTDLVSVTGRFCQSQTETFYRQMNEIVTTAQKAAILQMDGPKGSR
jgi:hypothetical protein